MDFLERAERIPARLKQISSRYRSSACTSLASCECRPTAQSSDDREYKRPGKCTLTPVFFAGKKQDVVVLFADIRGFSEWCDEQPLENVGDLMTTQIERAGQICNDHHHAFHKFLGDGFLLVWEPDDTLDLTVCLAHALDAAIHLHRNYWYLSEDSAYAVPPGYGVGIAIGEAIRLQPETILEEMNEVDFVGYPLNCAARMQSFASAYGTAVCSRTTQMLRDDAKNLLKSTTPGFRRELLTPGPEALGLAMHAKGLREPDRSDFRYLSFEDARARLWKASGMPES